MLGSALGPLRPPGIQDTSGRLVSVPSAGENIYILWVLIRQKEDFGGADEEKVALERIVQIEAWLQTFPGAI